MADFLAGGRAICPDGRVFDGEEDGVGVAAAARLHSKSA